MERSIAVKKLARILGKNFGYQIDSKAPTREAREEAKRELAVANANKRDLAEQIVARQNELLKADPEYQRLLEACKVARKGVEHLQGIAWAYKITVGVSNNIFFHIKAEGDSWEEVIAKLTREDNKAA